MRVAYLRLLRVGGGLVEEDLVDSRDVFRPRGITRGEVGESVVESRRHGVCAGRCCEDAEESGRPLTEKRRRNSTSLIRT